MTGMHKGVTDVPLCIGQSIKRKKEGTFPPIFNSLTHTTAVSLFFLAVVVRERKWRGACMRKFLHKLPFLVFFLGQAIHRDFDILAQKKTEKKFVRVALVSWMHRKVIVTTIVAFLCDPATGALRVFSFLTFLLMDPNKCTRSLDPKEKKKEKD